MEHQTSCQEVLHCADLGCATSHRNLDQFSVSAVDKSVSDQSHNYVQLYDKYSEPVKKRNFNMASSDSVSFCQNTTTSGDNRTYSHSAQEEAQGNDGRRNNGKHPHDKEQNNENSVLPYVSSGDFMDKLDSACSNKNEDDWLHGNQWDQTEGRIHKPLPARQNSAAFDIILSNSEKPTTDMVNEAQINEQHQQTKELHSARADDLTGTKQYRYGQQEETPHDSIKYQFNLQQQQGHNLKQQYNLKPFKHPANVHTFGRSQYGNEKGCCVTNFNNEQSPRLSQVTLKPNSSNSQLILQGRKVEISESENPHGDAESSLGYCPAKKIMEFPSEEAVSFDRHREKINTDLYRDTESFRNKKKTVKTLSLLSRDPHTNLLLVIVAMLFVTVIHQHMRLHAIERGEASLRSLCECCKNGRLSGTEKTAQTANVKKTVDEDVYTKTVQYFDDRDNDARPGGDDVSRLHPDGHFRERAKTLDAGAFLVDSVVSELNHPQTVDQFTKKEINQDTSASNDIKHSSETSLENASTMFEYPSDVSSRRHASYIGRKENNNSVGATSDLRILDIPRTDLSKSGNLLSRSIRSPKEKVVDGNFAGLIRKKHPKSPESDKNNNRKGRNKNTKPQSNVESYEVHFYGIFNYSRDFHNKDCTRNHRWNDDTEACKDQRVIFHNKNSILPFYTDTEDTKKKDMSKRLMIHDSKTPGKFHVQFSGDYLVNLNITIVDHTEQHFLALHLNNQAVLACQQGGFPCAHRNSNGHKKYRICNIVGVLELHKNDVLDIRTMHASTTVRLETKYKSYFRVILLNKVK